MEGMVQAGIADESLLHAAKDEHDPHSGDEDSDGNETVTACYQHQCQRAATRWNMRQPSTIRCNSVK
jgi:hypothetical protein